jgi:hypothetical protein
MRFMKWSLSASKRLSPGERVDGYFDRTRGEGQTEIIPAGISDLGFAGPPQNRITFTVLP